MLVEDAAVEEAVSPAVLLFLRKGQLRLVSVVTGVAAGLRGISRESAGAFGDRH